MSERITYEVAERIAIIRMDDGKANAMQLAWCAQMADVLDRVERDDAFAVVLAGRRGFFSGGLDLKVLPGLAVDEMRRTTEAFMQTMRRVFLLPKPVVAASCGHAIAGGMMLYLAADLRVALADEVSRYGLNEATNGIPLLGGTAGICQYSIPRVHHTEVVLHGRMLTARETLERQITHGLGETPEAVLEQALGRASSLSGVEPRAYAINKRLLREPHYEAAVERAKQYMAHAPSGNPFAGLQR